MGRPANKLKQAEPKVKGWRFRVKWGDFKKAVPKGHRTSNKAAFVKVGFKADCKYPRTADGKYRIVVTKVVVKMYRYSSWRKSSEESDEMLEHEQGHYDICCLAARDLCAALQQSEPCDTLSEAKTDMMLEQANWVAAGYQVNAKYEKETNNGLDEKKQREWNAKIQKAKTKGLAVTSLK